MSRTVCRAPLNGGYGYNCSNTSIESHLDFMKRNDRLKESEMARKGTVHCKAVCPARDPFAGLKADSTHLRMAYGGKGILQHVPSRDQSHLQPLRERGNAGIALVKGTEGQESAGRGKRASA